MYISAPENRSHTRERVPKVPILGVGDAIGAGDSYLALDVVPKNVAETAFEKLKEEVQWNTMHHQGESLSSFLLFNMLTSNTGGDVPRLVAVEGEVAEDGRYDRYILSP